MISKHIKTPAANTKQTKQKTAKTNTNSISSRWMNISLGKLQN